MKLTVKDLSMTAVMAAVIWVLSPVAVPLATHVPISLATLAVMLSGALLGSRLGTLAAAVYIIVGALGMPVFANYSSGISVLFGMTGGYIFGYLPLAHLSGWIYERFGRNRDGYHRTAVLMSGMLCGNAVLYTVGTIWFMLYTGMPLSGALAACVLPFLPGDLLKMCAVCVLVPRLEPALRRIAVPAH